MEDVPRKFWKKPLIELATGKKLKEIVALLVKAGARAVDTTAARSPSISDEIDTSWKRIETWIRKNAKGWKPLKRGATDKQIDKTIAEIGLELPDDWKSFYRLHNGADDLIPATDVSYFVMPLSEVVDDWKIMGELLDEGNFENRKAKPEKGIRKAWWCKGWIPFASNGGGDYYCVDLEPAKGGKAGQVISFNHESGEHQLLAESLRKWLFEFANSLESGQYRYDGDEGLS